MGTASVSFFTRSGFEGHQIYPGAPISAENVTTSGTAAASGAAPDNCIVRVCPDTTCRVLIGGTAVAASPRVPADTVFDAHIAKGQTVSLIEG